jgi:hypothetical protein
MWIHENSFVNNGGYETEHSGSVAHFLTKIHKVERISRARWFSPLEVNKGFAGTCRLHLQAIRRLILRP